MTDRLVLQRLPGRFAVCRLDADAPLPAWAAMRGASLLSITRTEHELSIIIDQSLVGPDVQTERDYLAWALDGPLEFSMVGVLARLTAALAEAQVPLLAVSTYDTDVLLVKAEDGERAEAALRTIAEFRRGQ